MKTPRHLCTAVVVDDQALVIGSYNDDDKYLLSVEICNIYRGQWTNLPSMNMQCGHTPGAMFIGRQ
eukprot:CAMPEP_0116862770 /NCGR_PEP_ID=MMETSP0418-20121206/23826_1 /TAXON_ID=1158023 /ORGANISM="Astrosyne radiata, Strain 13vi08-1A" /LENGTH=65 /DNA_ID=CAMNT_0004497667 /DNA_START=252 /DNA_END=446 /DNA_ORIENTATION=-